MERFKISLLSALFECPQNADPTDGILCNGFFQPVVDNEELLRLWQEDNEKHCDIKNACISQKICPYINALLLNV